MANLSKKDILINLKKSKLDERLVITPLLNEKQIADGAIDLRLGTEFIVTKRTEFLGLDPAKRNKGKSRNVYQELIKVDFKNKFVLHPNQLVLGSTLEYISMPKTLSAYVLSRSSWGRLGLIIATATYVNAGFKGCLTLELENLGEVPLALYPGLRIAQLVIHELSSEGSYNGQYLNPTGPEFSKALEDSEIDFWAPQKVVKSN